MEKLEYSTKFQISSQTELLQSKIYMSVYRGRINENNIDRGNISFVCEARLIFFSLFAIEFSSNRDVIYRNFAIKHNITVL